MVLEYENELGRKIVIAFLIPITISLILEIRKAINIFLHNSSISSLKTQEVEEKLTQVEILVKL